MLQLIQILKLYCTLLKHITTATVFTLIFVLLTLTGKFELTRA